MIWSACATLAATVFNGCDRRLHVRRIVFLQRREERQSKVNERERTPRAACHMYLVVRYVPMKHAVAPTVVLEQKREATTVPRAPDKRLQRHMNVRNAARGDPMGLASDDYFRTSEITRPKAAPRREGSPIPRARKRGQC